MLVKVSQQAVEDLALLVEQQVLKRCHLLLVQHLLDDLREVAAQDRKGRLILVQEAAELVHERVVLPLGWRGRLGNSLILGHDIVL